MKKTAEVISKREFAKRVGVTDTAINKAIQKGFIEHGVDSNGKLIYEVALGEWNNRPKSIQEANKNQLEKEVKENGGDNFVSFNEAKRREALLKVQMLAIEIKERKGELVERVKVDNELFDLGAIIRTSLQGIPDKHIDNILACATRQEAHSILYKAITESLEALQPKK